MVLSADCHQLSQSEKKPGQNGESKNTYYPNICNFWSLSLCQTASFQAVNQHCSLVVALLSSHLKMTKTEFHRMFTTPVPPPLFHLTHSTLTNQLPATISSPPIGPRLRFAPLLLALDHLFAILLPFSTQLYFPSTFQPLYSACYQLTTAIGNSMTES